MTYENQRAAKGAVPSRVFAVAYVRRSWTRVYIGGRECSKTPFHNIEELRAARQGAVGTQRQGCREKVVHRIPDRADDKARS